MRQIKFRAWEIIWRYMLCEDQLWCIPYNELFIHTPDQRPFNLMQFTGLVDRNCKEIYEGDIIRNLGYEELCIVEWNQGQYIGRYSPQTPHYPLDESKKVKERGDLSYIGLGFYAIERNSLEVIGNIYENPELLGGGGV